MSQEHLRGGLEPRYGSPRETARAEPVQGQSANLADILERVLDKGIVIAGDIRVDLLDIELLTIKIRLIVASVDRAREMGIDWWEYDPNLSTGKRDVLEENERLRRRVDELEEARRPGGADAALAGATYAEDDREAAEFDDADRWTEEADEVDEDVEDVADVERFVDEGEDAQR